MYGAFLGDMIGAPFEYDRGDKTKDFPLFSEDSELTDDSIMTIAVCEALLSDEDDKKQAVIRSMQKWGQRYPDAGYGVRFSRWLEASDPEPYDSYGNGSAMRVSSVGWLYDSLEETNEMAKLTAEVSHNHPEGIKGAQAAASAIFLARNGSSKDEIRKYITEEFGYDLSRTCDEIRPVYHHVESCQETVPEAITAFLEGEDFEDVIRTAVSLGGDCDTLTCIAGGIAEAFYGVPDELKVTCRNHMTEDMLHVLDQFEKAVKGVMPAFHDPYLDGNEEIERAIAEFNLNQGQEALVEVMEAICDRMDEGGHFLFPVETNSGDAMGFKFRILETDDGGMWQAAFTSEEENEKGPWSRVISQRIDTILKLSLEDNITGVVVNPWDKPFSLHRSLIEAMFYERE